VHGAHPLIEASLGVVAFLWVVALPGVLVARLALPTASRAERLVIGVVLGLALAPLASFAVAMLLGTIVTPRVAIVTAAVANGVLGSLLWLRAERARRSGR
jgi:hypothetical protein